MAVVTKNVTTDTSKTIFLNFSSSNDAAHVVQTTQLTCTPKRISTNIGTPIRNQSVQL